MVYIGFYKLVLKNLTRWSQLKNVKDIKKTAPANNFKTTEMNKSKKENYARKVKSRNTRENLE